MTKLVTIVTSRLQQHRPTHFEYNIHTIVALPLISNIHILRKRLYNQFPFYDCGKLNNKEANSPPITHKGDIALCVTVVAFFVLLYSHLPTFLVFFFLLSSPLILPDTCHLPIFALCDAFATALQCASLFITDSELYILPPSI